MGGWGGCWCRAVQCNAIACCLFAPSPAALMLPLGSPSACCCCALGSVRCVLPTMPTPYPSNPCAPPALPRRAPPQPDKSGRVSVERLQRTLREFELAVDITGLLAAMDTDADGSVSYEEFKALLSGAA